MTAQYQLDPQGSVTSPQGFSAAAVACGIKESGRPDLALVVSDRDCHGAAVFTRSQVLAAPVIVDRETMAVNNSTLRSVVINAGNANACTGQPGIAHARTMQALTAEQTGCIPNQVLVMSTGIIGLQLPMGKVETGIEAAAKQLSPQNGSAAAEAIMTTDTRPKHLAIVVDLPDGPVTIGGMAKGSGMIHPDMATMLCLLTTDAHVPAETLDSLLRTAVSVSFNSISVDGDTSTNDTVLLLANGASGLSVAGSEAIALFSEALTAVCQELAWMIVRDGEGATRFVEIQVTGAVTPADAHQVAATMATSPLVKTSFAGGDPNWGRLLMAAGRSKVPFDQDNIQLWIGIQEATELQLVEQGIPTAFGDPQAAAIFSAPEFKIRLDLGAGQSQATMWTTDLTHAYVSINADYRT